VKKRPSKGQHVVAIMTSWPGSGKRYRIYTGASVNVCEINERGRVQEGLCFMPIGGLPIGDVMLAQKIALETYKSEVRALAQEVHS
jgi:hypothetical protein